MLWLAWTSILLFILLHRWTAGRWHHPQLFIGWNGVSRTFFPRAGIESQSCWSLPPKQLGLEVSTAPDPLHRSQQQDLEPSNCLQGTWLYPRMKLNSKREIQMCQSATKVKTHNIRHPIKANEKENTTIMSRKPSKSHQMTQTGRHGYIKLL
jgi:hypothetical protein